MTVDKADGDVVPAAIEMPKPIDIADIRRQVRRQAHYTAHAPAEDMVIDQPSTQSINKLIIITIVYY